MSAYLAHDFAHALQILALLAVTLTVGYALTRAPLWLGRLGSWALVLGGFTASHWICVDEPAGFRMLAIIGVVLFAMKSVVAVEARHHGEATPGPLAWWAWAGAWPGMAPALFVHLDAPDAATAPPAYLDRRDAADFLLRGLVRLLIGAAMLGLAFLSWRWTGSRVLATVFALPGLSLILHFGLFNLACGFWRLFGVPTYTLFPAPLMSTSLAEFWGRRWNLPFTEMIQRALYRPLASPMGRNLAAATGFLFSGVLHECAISVPVMQGFGLPMVYFIIHGALVVLERSTSLGAWLNNHPFAARSWTLGWLALPMPILFHPPFLAGVVWPLIGVPAAP